MLFYKCTWQKYLHMIKIEFTLHKRVLFNKSFPFTVKWRQIKTLIARKCTSSLSVCKQEKAYLQHGLTAYVDEASNYNLCCKRCHEEMEDIYEEMWEEYNSGRI